MSEKFQQQFILNGWKQKQNILLDIEYIFLLTQVNCEKGSQTNFSCSYVIKLSAYKIFLHLL